MRLRENMIRAAIRQFCCCCCCAKKPTGCVDISQQEKAEDAAVFVGKPIEEFKAEIQEPIQVNEQNEQKQVQEPELPGVVEVDDRLPVLDLPDGDACGLQIFELLGRGVSGCRVHRCHQGDRIMAGKILPLGPATFPDMVEDWENEVAVFKAAGEPMS